MATKNEELQRLFHRYQEEHGGVPETPYTVVKWAIANGLLAEPDIDPAARLAEEMAKALREEYKTDSRGRRYRVNHAARIRKNGIQYSLWAKMDLAPPDHMAKSFQQRRQQVVGDCFQLRTDVDVYNEKHPELPPYQLVLNFQEDVDELQAAYASDDDGGDDDGGDDGNGVQGE